MGPVWRILKKLNVSRLILTMVVIIIRIRISFKPTYAWLFMQKYMLQQLASNLPIWGRDGSSLKVGLKFVVTICISDSTNLVV